MVTIILMFLMVVASLYAGSQFGLAAELGQGWSQTVFRINSLVYYVVAIILIQGIVLIGLFSPLNGGVYER